MAQGTQFLTTYYAKRIIGDSNAGSSQNALLQAGTGESMWIFGHRENYGIYYNYSNDQQSINDRIEFVGGTNTNQQKNIVASIKLRTGDTYIKGRVGINHEITDTNNGNFLSGQLIIADSGSASIELYNTANSNLSSWHIINNSNILSFNYNNNNDDDTPQTISSLKLNPTGDGQIPQFIVQEIYGFNGTTTREASLNADHGTLDYNSALYLNKEAGNVCIGTNSAENSIYYANIGYTLDVQNLGTGAGRAALFVNGGTRIKKKLEVGDEAYIIGNTTIGGTASITGNTTIGGTASITGNTTIGTSSSTATFEVKGIANITGNTTIGTSSSTVTFKVFGTTDITSNITIGGTASITSNITIGGTASITGNTTIGTQGTLSNVQNLTVYGATGIYGNVAIGTSSLNVTFKVFGTTDITGNTTIGGTTSITGNTTIGTSSSNATFEVFGTANITSDTTIGGIATITGNTTIGGTVSITGATTISGTLNATSNSNLQGAVIVGTSSATTSLTVYGTTTISGNTTINSTTSGSFSSGALRVAGGVSVGGSIYNGGSIYARGTGATLIQAGHTIGNDVLAVGLYIGTGYENHGIYSWGYNTSGVFTSNGKWMVYRDKNGDIYLNGNAATATSATSATSAATATALSSNAGSVNTPVYFSGGKPVACNNKLGAASGDYWGIASPANSDSVYIRTTSKGLIPHEAGGAGSGHCNLGTSSWRFAAAYVDTVRSNKTYGAVWNDIAECRETTVTDPGRVIVENKSGIMELSTYRLQPTGRILSDTFGYCMGEPSMNGYPVAIAGRVLVYPYRDPKEYQLGDCVCAAPGGTVDIMTREEIKEYSDRIIGIVSEIPNYEIWSAGAQNGTNDILVNGRIWIYVK